MRLLSIKAYLFFSLRRGKKFECRTKLFTDARRGGWRGGALLQSPSRAVPIMFHVLNCHEMVLGTGLRSTITEDFILVAS